MMILLYIFTILVVLYIYVCKLYKIKTTTTVKSNKLNQLFVVQDKDDKKDAALILENVHERIMRLRQYLSENINLYPEYKQYIKQFVNRIVNLSLHENSTDGMYTSYTVNKGEEIALCLRSKKTLKLHDINLVMYVVIHELSHVACPENNHTELFKKIFKFFLKCAIKINIYSDKNYTVDPHEYCGMVINEYLL